MTDTVLGFSLIYCSHKRPSPVSDHFLLYQWPDSQTYWSCLPLTPWERREWGQVTLDPLRIRLPYQGWLLRRELTLFCKNFSNDKKCYKNGAIHQLMWRHGGVELVWWTFNWSFSWEIRGLEIPRPCLNTHSKLIFINWLINMCTCVYKAVFTLAPKHV